MIHLNFKTESRVPFFFSWKDPKICMNQSNNMQLFQYNFGNNFA